MSKTILIFSDGTGQIGGLRPDQRLSNVYKIYRATRPGPSSPIDPTDQVTFYDAGLGAGEVGGLTFKRIRNFFASAVGNGIDENIIDCYQAIIANYQDGDRICLIGFSRGAYTVRCVANVMNLCGVPTRMSEGGPVPTNGPRLRKIAEDAVKYVYNHGAGKKRRDYFTERETKAERFRAKYGSEGIGADGEGQGNVQPTFIGVFDTVAALGSRKMQWIAIVAAVALTFWTVWAYADGWSWIARAIPTLILSPTLYWLAVTTKAQLKYFRAVPGGPITSWHFASWNLQNYDLFLDNLVRYARHAISVDEDRKSFPRVGWGHMDDIVKNAHLDPPWLRQVWFAGNHSDIGGSYPEPESRLSDIALRWMVDEMRLAVPEVIFREELLVTMPDATGLQHDEVLGVQQIWPGFVPSWLRRRLTWTRKIRVVDPNAELHSSVQKRLAAGLVPHVDDVRPYAPANLQEHAKVGEPTRKNINAIAIRSSL